MDALGHGWRGEADNPAKFVKGDAIAGIIILVINIIGGFIIGVAMRGESMSAAAHAAGFADAAHLTRTSKRMFGFAPSLMPIGPNERR